MKFGPNKLSIVLLLLLTAVTVNFGSPKFLTGLDLIFAKETVSFPGLTAPCVSGEKTWDGEGITNNWSEPANWTCDALPTVFESAIFDGTSPKNVTIDIDPAQGVHVRIRSGYGGTVSTSSTSTITLDGYTQDTGSFVCGAGQTLTFRSNNSVTLNAGTFNCSAGTIDGKFASFVLNGGTFDMPTGTFTLGENNGGGSIRRETAAVLNHNNGTLILRQGTLIFIGPPQELNNVQVTTATTNLASSTIRVLGTLDLQSGMLFSDSSGIAEVHGALNTSPAYGAPGAAQATLIFVRSANTPSPRTIALPSGLGMTFHPVTLNDASTTINVTGGSNANFQRLAILAGVFNTGVSHFAMIQGPYGNNYSQSGGTFNCGTDVFLNGTVSTLSGGTFDCTNGMLSLTNGNHTFSGGTFEMPAGAMTLNNTVISCSGATMHNNGGTLVADPSNRSSLNLGGGVLDLTDLTAGVLNINGTLRINGSLNLSTGLLTGGTYEALGPVNIDPSYGGNSFGCCTEGVLRLAGTSTRSVIIPVGMPGRLNRVLLDAPNTTVTLNGTGIVGLTGITLNQGTFNTGATGMDMASTGSGAPFIQNGGQFIAGGGAIRLGESLTLNAGTFNSELSDLTVSNNPFSTFMTLNGGIFIAPAGTMTLSAATLTKGGASTFTHSNGTLLATGNGAGLNFNNGATGMDINNLTVALDNTFFQLGGAVRALGNVSLQSGNLRGLSLEIHKDVTVSNSFNDNNDDPADIIFAGGNAQVFTNNGGANPRGSWAVNKTAGSTLTIASGLIQTPLFSQLAPLNIASGNVYLADGSDLTVGNLTVGTNGKLISDSSTTITLAGNVSNSGIIDLQGGGAGCPENDSILIRSSIDGTQRSWSGSGSYLLADVDVKDMGGPAGGGGTPKRVFSGTNSGNVDASWIFAGGCPGALSISPASVDLQVGQTQTFTPGGGAPPYTFSLLTNNSGATINASTGLYTAGSTPSVTDTVRLTDDAGATVDATVNLSAPCVAGQKTWDGGGSTNNWSEAANWTCNIVPTASDTVTFDSTSIKNVVIDTNISVASIRVNSGYTGSVSQEASAITLNGAYTQSSGTFGGGSGTMTFNGTFVQSGGTFNATSGTATFTGSVFELGSGATFNHNNGSVIFAANSMEVRIISGVTATQDFGNLAISTPGGLFGSDNDTLRVNGTLALNNGAIFSVIVEARGPVNVANTLGNGTDDPGAGKILFSGAASRTITLPVLAGAYNAIELNAPNTTVNLTGTGQAKLNRLDLVSGTFNAGNTSVRFHRPGNGQSTQSGGVFDCGTGTITYAFGNFTQTGGLYNCQNATIDSTTDSGLQIILNGGTFNAPAGTMTFNGGIFERGPGGTFNHNNGTVIFGGNTDEVRIVNGATATQDFGNLTLAAAGGLFGSDNDLLRVNGNLTLGGQAISANFEARGNVTVQSGFSTNTSTNLTFASSNAQTYTNNGGTNPTGIFAINKPSGTVTAATSLILGATQPLSITSGTLYLNDGSNLSTGNLSIGTNGKLVNDSTTTITLGGGVANSGLIDLQGGGAGCPENDTIVIRSSVPGTQRSWSGAGIYRLIDVDVKDMSGPTTAPNIQKRVFSGTDGLNNNASWIFDASCPANLSISPQFANIQTGGTQQFTAAGGIAPYTFSFVTNSSGGTINASTGSYTAGSASLGFDTIRVTDAFGATADANVTLFGQPERLVFSVQPSNAVAGASIAPPIKVTILDEDGVVVVNSSALITLSLSANPSSGTLSGTVTRPAVNGVATFDDVSINRSGVGYRLQAAMTGVNSQNSSFFNISPAAASKLSFVAQPPNTDAGSQFSVSVAVQDAFGNTVTNATHGVNIAIDNNPTGTTLQGTTFRNALNGIVVFDNLQINTPGNGFTLKAVANPLTLTTSDPFNITNPFVVTNMNDSGPGSLRQIVTLANNTPGTQTITFNLPGPPPYSIGILSSLPPIQDAIIDGRTQPGFAGSPIVEVRQLSTGTMTGLLLRSSTVRGLVLNGFRQGIAVALTTGISVVEGNYIGTDVSGAAAIPNSKGIFAGSPAGGEIRNNIISGNSSVAMDITGAGYLVESNTIGIGTTGAPLGNNRGITFGSQARRNKLTRNRIFNNTNTGISLETINGPLLNDTRDPDAGPNELQNYPVLVSAVSEISRAVIGGTLNSTPSKTYTLEFFSSPSCDASGNGEGETFVGSTQVTTDAGGIVGFTANVNATPSGRVITATATDPDGNTSEFSRCIVVTPQTHSIFGRVLLQSASRGLQSARVTLTGTGRFAATDSGGFYSFPNVPGEANYTIVPSAPATTFSPISRSVANLSTDIFGQDFTATQTGQINGIVESSFGGSRFGISDAVVNISGPEFRSLRTDSSGRYFSGPLLVGSYSVTVFKQGYAYLPQGLFVSSTSVLTANFFAAAPPVFGRSIITDGSNLRAMNADGSGLVRLASSVTNGLTFGKPSFSKDGSEIVYTRMKCPDTNPLGCLPNQMISSIFTANFDGSGEHRTIGTSSGRSFVQPAFSPDGTKVAYVQKFGGAIDQYASQSIFVQTRASGTGIQVFAAAPGTFISDMAFSPDGTKIAFVQRRVNTIPRIFIMTIASRQLMQLTTINSTNPTWSPFGNQLGFISGGSAFKINVDGTGQTPVGGPLSLTDLSWSPDGNFFGFIQNGAYGVMTVDGDQPTVFRNDLAYSQISWGRTYIAPHGSNRIKQGTANTVVAGSVELTFSDPSFAGDVTVVPISVVAGADPPDGFALTETAYDISSSDPVSGTTDVCIRLAPELLPRLDKMHILHEESGVLVDRTTSRDIPTGRVCALTSGLSRFVVAEAIDTVLARISGLIQDGSGLPMSGVQVTLSGAEDRVTSTNSTGAFTFVNLTPGANYNISPKRLGTLFDEYDHDLINVTGEQTVLFVGTAGSFQISGRVTRPTGDGVGGATLQIDGDRQATTVTDVNGDYAFTGLPADGSFIIVPSDGLSSFSPVAALVQPLTSDNSGIDFELSALTAAEVAVSGRVVSSDGRGIRNARVTITGNDGREISTMTGPAGAFRFDAITAGRTYVIGVASRRFQFESQVVSVSDNISDLTFVAGGQTTYDREE
jgi:hypothetical protein